MAQTERTEAREIDSTSALGSASHSQTQIMSSSLKFFYRVVRIERNRETGTVGYYETRDAAEERRQVMVDANKRNMEPDFRIGAQSPGWGYQVKYEIEMCRMNVDIAEVY